MENNNYSKSLNELRDTLPKLRLLPGLHSHQRKYVPPTCRKRRIVLKGRVQKPIKVPLIRSRQIISAYDTNGDGICETIEVAKWMVDCYRAMNRSFQPTATDIASYVQVVDKNHDGKVSLEDLEEFIVRYFHNPHKG